MTIRRLLWVMIPLLLLVVLGGAGAIGWFLLRGQTAPIRLVAVGPNTNVRLVGQGGEQLLASDASDAGEVNFAYPTPAPDGRRLAYVGVGGDGAAIFLLDLASGERRELYRSRDHFPFDLNWSPDGKYVAFLAGSPLSVMIVPADGSKPAKPVVTGQPVYFAWSPDSSALLLHVGGHSTQEGHLSVYAVGPERADTLLNDPGLFQAPAWALDGQHFFYAAQPPIGKAQPELSDTSSNIVRVNADGKEPTTLVAEKQSFLWMVRAPNSNQVAYVARVLDDSGAAVLKLVDGDSGAARTLSRPDEHVTAFFWSPDGQRIAYLTHDGTYRPDTPRTWHIVDLDGGAVHDFEKFTPSPAFAALQVFFDAYTFSFSPWSPDGSRVVYGTDDGLYMLDIAAGRAIKASDGTIGMWVGGR